MTVDSVVGRVTRVAVFRGEPIVPGRLAPPGTGPGLEVKITPGKRAMALKINDVAGISGLIQPNSRVDVLVTIRDAITKSDQQVAKLFMENMRVLSVGTQVQRGEDGRPISATTATLEVTPEEAEQLAIAANQGSIQLVLRGYGDPDSVVTAGATSVDVLKQLREAQAQAVRPPQPRARPVSRPAPPPPVVVQPPRPPDSLTVKIYRGGRLSQEKFDTSSAGSNP
jgi:pilus assembly protein CpaB